MSESDIDVLRADNRRMEAKIERLEEKLDALVQAFKESSARHSQRLNHVEADVNLAHSRISGVKKWVLGGVCAFASMAAKSTWAIVESIAKKG